MKALWGGLVAFTFFSSCFVPFFRSLFCFLFLFSYNAHQVISIRLFSRFPFFCSASWFCYHKIFIKRSRFSRVTHSTSQCQECPCPGPHVLLLRHRLSLSDLSFKLWFPFSFLLLFLLIFQLDFTWLSHVCFLVLFSDSMVLFLLLSLCLFLTFILWW